MIKLSIAGLRLALMAGIILSCGQSFAYGTDTRDVVRDSANGTIVHSSNGNCVRTKWDAGYDACREEAAETVVAPRKMARQISREDRTVYFAFNQAGLSADSKARLDTLANDIKSEGHVKGVRIFGYADRIGNPSYNEKLSKKRADNVRHYLAARGLINTRVTETRWFGENEPATSCSNDLKRAELIDCLQKDRRVEVEIDYTADQQASR